MGNSPKDACSNLRPTGGTPGEGYARSRYSVPKYLEERPSQRLLDTEYKDATAFHLLVSHPLGALVIDIIWDPRGEGKGTKTTVYFDLLHAAA